MFKYHDSTDIRRNPKFYKPILCPNLYENSKKKKNSKCEFGDKCQNCHNLYEYFYHPKIFRTKECPQEIEKQICKNRLLCPYYHKPDFDCGKDGERMKLDKELITNYYKSLMLL